MYKCIIHVYNVHVCTYSTQKVVGITTLSRSDHTVPQMREVAKKEVLPQVFEQGRAIQYCVFINYSYTM